MHTFRPSFFALCAAASFLVACQTTQPRKVSSNPEPQVQFSLRSNGKGVPNGRTDSALPYLRLAELKTSSDPEYGYSPDKPIKTGPAASKFHLLYLNSLRGPNGEVVEYERKGSCCEFEDKTLPLGVGILDAYRIKVDGRSDVVTLYVDMYRKGLPQFPVGFTARK